MKAQELLIALFALLPRTIWPMERDTEELRPSIRLDNRVRVSRYPIRAVTPTFAGRFVAVAGEFGKLVVIDRTSARIKWARKISNSSVRELVLNGTSTIIVARIGGPNAAIVALASRTGKVLARVSSGNRECTSLVFSADDRFLVQGFDDGSLRVLSTSDWRARHGTPKAFGAGVKQLVRLGNTQLVAVLCDDNRIRIWSLPVAKPVRLWHPIGDIDGSMYFDTRTKNLMIGVNGGHIATWNTIRGEEQPTFHGADEAVAKICRISGGRLFSFGSLNYIWFWQPASAIRLKHLHLTSGMFDVVPDGRFLFIRQEEGLTAYDPATSALSTVTPPHSQPYSIRADGSGLWATTYGDDGLVCFWSVKK